MNRILSNLPRNAGNGLISLGYSPIRAGDIKDSKIVQKIVDTAGGF